MKNCKDCKYFTETHWQHAVTKGIEFSGFGQCSNSHLLENGNLDDDSCLNATCDEDRGELEIGQNFGCIYFEAAEIKNDPIIKQYL